MQYDMETGRLEVGIFLIMLVKVYAEILYITHYRMSYLFLNINYLKFKFYISLNHRVKLPFFLFRKSPIFVFIHICTKLPVILYNMFVDLTQFNPLRVSDRHKCLKTPWGVVGYIISNLRLKKIYNRKILV